MSFRKRIQPAFDRELSAAAVAGSDPKSQFSHLERAHVLGQSSTVLHTYAHLEMARWAMRQRDIREFGGQCLRIVGAVTKTAFGWVPVGNTGGANVSPFKPLPLPLDLAEEIQAARLASK